MCLVAGCGGTSGSDAGSTDKPAGAICTPTAEGAAECASSVCLQGVKCINGVVLNACAGADCTKTGSCATVGEQCVPVEATTMAFCLPSSVCNSVPDGGSAADGNCAASSRSTPQGREERNSDS